MCLLLESIRVYRNIPEQLHLHEQRLNRSRKLLFGRNVAELSLKSAIDTSLLDPAKVYKARVIAAERIESVEILPYQKRPISSVRLVEANLNYEHKYLDRTALDLLFQKRATADDVLIVRNGRLTDCSYSNVCFWDGKHWITPEQPLLAGTRRAFLLQQGLIRTADIAIDDLLRLKKLSLVNAMLDLGEVELDITQIVH